MNHQSSQSLEFGSLTLWVSSTLGTQEATEMQELSVLSTDIKAEAAQVTLTQYAGIPHP